MDKQDAIALLSAAVEESTVSKAEILDAASCLSIRECNEQIREWTQQASILRSQAHDLYLIAGYVSDDVRRRAETLDE